MPGILDLLDSDMETNNFIDENSLISSVSDETGLAQAKGAVVKKAPKKRKPVTIQRRPRAKSPAEPKQKASSKTSGAKRKAANDDAHDEDELVETEAAKPRARPPKTTKARDTTTKSSAAKTTKVKSAKREIPEEEPEEEGAVPSPVAVRSDFAQTKVAKSVPRPVPAVKTKPNSQKPRKQAARPIEEVVSEVEDEEEDDIAEQQPPRKRIRTESRMRQEPVYRRRAGSASDTERGDPMLRRKLGDMTRKYENIDAKYRNLKDVAVSEANANVEKMRRQCEAVTEASDKLVASLKQQIVTHAPLIQKTRKVERDAQLHEVEINKLRAANNDLSTTLAAAQNEIRALQAKLATARATPVPAEVKQPPTTTKTVVQAKVLASSSNENEKAAQLKIDLYSDLTGLIVQSVKRVEDGDTYDCIQTGRNGSLHFKLFVDHENAKRVSFEETEFLYTPMLDANRDRDLIEMMPDYLTEDITFEREVAAKFYARVVKTLTEKPVVEETD